MFGRARRTGALSSDRQRILNEEARGVWDDASA
jgi:hypothetical protein